MRLHVHEWGDPAAPKLVCLHGVTGHGEQYGRLAEERWASHFHVLAPDLRGHGRSGWDPPWTNATHVADLLETFGDLPPADWVGHSWGGRLVLELAARRPERVRRAVLLDPAIQVLPHVALNMAELERQEPLYASAEDYADRRLDAPPRGLVLLDAEQHCEVLADGRLRRRTCQPAVVTIYGELASEPPPPEALQSSALLLYSRAYGLVRDEQLAAYADRVQLLAVPGMHMVMWDAFDETAGAVERFLLEDPRLQDPRAER